MCSIAWRHFQRPWRTRNRFSRSRQLWSRISQKRCISGTMLLKNTNRKPYAIFRMVPLSMTLSDLWPRFQGHDIFWSWISEKRRVLNKEKVTIAQEESIPNIWNGIMFGDLDWPLNLSRGFVSISWAFCYIWPVWLEIAYSRPFLGSFGDMTGFPLELGTGARGQKKLQCWGYKIVEKVLR